MNQALIDKLSTAKVLVLGDLMLDRYWSGGTTRISPEAPVPVVKIGDEFERLGGSGNVAANISALGGQAHLLAMLGDDEAADSVVTLARQGDIDCHLLRDKQSTTTVKLRIISQQQQLLRLDFEKTDVTQQQIDDFHLKFDDLLRSVGAVVVSDYGKGGVPNPETVIEQAKAVGVPVLVDPKGRDYAKYRYAQLVTPNYREFEEVVGPCSSEQILESKAKSLIGDLDIDAILITRGDKGMTLVRREQATVNLAAQTREVFDVTGAGDTVCGVCAVGIACGIDLETSIGLANKAAGIVVGKFGTATVSANELHISTSALSKQKTFDELQLKEVLEKKRADGARIVMTNGCFDVLHAGHVEYLRNARLLGDYLVVAVNSDSSVSTLKGENRPIHRLSDRLAVLAALESVDALVSFEDSTPLALISNLRPDVLVKGGDYRLEEIVGGEEVIANGGRVEVLPFVEGHSSSSILNKMGVE